MQTIKLTPLSYKEGTFQGVDYSNIYARYDNKILKFKLDRSRVANLSNFIDQEVEADIEIVAGTNLLASLKIVAVRAA